MPSPAEQRNVVFYPTGRWAISENTAWNVYLVGCGGTGSFIAHSLAQLKASQPAPGRGLGRIVLIDPDLVEARNIGRQNFAPADTGYPKAQALAFRYNLAFGIDMEWVNGRFDASLLPKTSISLSRLLLIGAVDNGRARRTIAEALKKRSDDALWLDAGNGYDRGQVAIGNTFARRLLATSVDPNINIARYLPYPSLALPELLRDEPRPEPSCAQAVETESQSLYMNRFMASIVGEYLRRLVAGQLSIFHTWIHLATMEMVSVPVSAHNIQRYSGPPSGKKHSAIADPAAFSEVIPIGSVLADQTTV